MGRIPGRQELEREVLREDDQAALVVGGRIDQALHLGLERLEVGDGPDEILRG
ncbi:MAG: hypothetical protein WA133_03760 [Syntrophales bacterium]